MASGEMSRDKDKIPQSAKYTSATWLWGGLPYAEVTAPKDAMGIFKKVNIYMRLYRLINYRKHSLHHTLLHRHTMINHLFNQGKFSQVVEVAAGFSPRGCALSQDQEIDYYEVDLPDVVRLKRNQLACHAKGSEVLARSNFHQIAKSILDIDFAKDFPHKKSFFITEGLMMYFSRSEQLDIWKNIADFTQQCGGEYVFDYIPLDAVPERSLVGRALHRIKAWFGGDGQGYCYDERTRWDVRDDLLAQGFKDVSVIDSYDTVKSWGLPYSHVKTRVIVYHCR